MDIKLYVLDLSHLQEGPQQAFESINQSIYTVRITQKERRNHPTKNLNIYLYNYQKETAIFLATKHEKTVVACSYLIF